MAKFKKPEIKNPIINIYESSEMKKMFKDSIDTLYPNTGIKLNSLSLIVGGTGTGKSNAIVNIISNSSKGNGVFHKIILVCKTSNEKIYQFLKKKLGELFIIYSYDDMPQCKELEDQDVKDPNERYQYLIIFDDFLNESKKKMTEIMEYAMYGRKKGLTQLYLAQNYYSCPKFIRQQISHLLLLDSPNKTDLKRIISTYALPSNETDTMDMIQLATSQRLNFFKINLRADCPIKEKYSIGLTDYFDVE